MLDIFLTLYTQNVIGFLQQEDGIYLELLLDKAEMFLACLSSSERKLLELLLYYENQ